MRGAVLFKSDSGLDFHEVRSQILRVPEVLARINEAQNIWDRAGIEPVDFYQSMLSEEKNSFTSACHKALCQAIVQVGLYDRYVRKNGAPKFIIGNARNESAALVASGHKSFRQLVLGSRAAGAEEEPSPKSTSQKVQALPTLRGQMMPNFKAYQRQSSATVYEELKYENLKESELICALAEKENLRRLVSLGPGAIDLSLDERAGLLEEVQFFESIDMDPMLTWFWPTLKGAQACA